MEETRLQVSSFPYSGTWFGHFCCALSGDTNLQYEKSWYCMQVRPEINSDYFKNYKKNVGNFRSLAKKFSLLHTQYHCYKAMFRQTFSFWMVSVLKRQTKPENGPYFLMTVSIQGVILASFLMQTKPCTQAQTVLPK